MKDMETIASKNTPNTNLEVFDLCQMVHVRLHVERHATLL